MTLPNTDSAGRYQVVSGVLWMFGCLISFVAMAVASRELSKDLSIFQILFFRSVVGLIILLMFARTLWPELRRMNRLGLHLLRNIVHFGGQYCWTLGVALLPLVEVIAIEFTMPIWVALFAYLFMGERIGPPRLIAICVSFLGILVILRPGFTIIDPASLIVLLAAMFYGLSIVMVKRLAQDCSPGIIVVWMILMQFPMGLALAAFDWRPAGLEHIPWMVVAGASGLSAHYTMAKALRLLDATVVIPIDFVRVPLTALAGFYLYGESVEVWLFAGALLILGSNYYALKKEA